ncbi:MAG: tetraacyldisaccharide 4'-kinase, partial [Chitinispirillaceae bacterium]|nr:tetraacyldisaccharide 4'-kinase [Chitinispirillaceae bacterium]
MPPVPPAAIPFARSASSLFCSAVSLRNSLYDHLPFFSRRTPYPVVSIGGIRAGGTGKTPIALLVGRYLLSKGCTVAFLSRGYRRKDRRCRIVAPHETVDWELIGDEPWL